MVPTEVFRFIPRLALSVKLAVVASVPPLMKFTESGVGEPGTAPRLSSAATLKSAAELGTAGIGVDAAEDQRTGTDAEVVDSGPVPATTPL